MKKKNQHMGKKRSVKPVELFFLFLGHSSFFFFVKFLPYLGLPGGWLAYRGRPWPGYATEGKGGATMHCQ